MGGAYARAFGEAGFRCGGGGALRTGASKGWKRKARVGVRGRSKVRASCWWRWMGARGGAVASASGSRSSGRDCAGRCRPGRVEFDADDLAEGEFAGDEHGSAFAGADVEECVVVDGVGWGGVAPVFDEGAEDAGGYAVVGGDVGVVGVAGDEVAGGDEAAGVDAVGLVEGMDGGGGLRRSWGRLRLAA